MAVALSAKAWVAGFQPPGPPGVPTLARYPSLTSWAAMRSGGVTTDSSGISPSQASTPPATSTPAIRGPMM